MKALSGLLVLLVVLYGYTLQYQHIFVSAQALYILIAGIVIIGARYVFGLKIDSKRNVLYMVCLVSVLTVTILSRAPHFLFAFLIATSCVATGLTYRKMVSVYFFASIFLYILTLMLFALGLIPDNPIIRGDGTLYQMRSSLGFSNPNSAMLYALPIFASGYYLYGHKIRYYLVSVPFALAIFAATDSRTGLACLIVLFVLGLLFRKKDVLSQKTIYLISWLFVLLTAVSITISLQSGASDPGSTLNDALSQRPYFWSQYIDSGLLTSLFGGDKVPGLTLDNVYIFILVKMGLIAYGIYAVVYLFGTRFMRRDRKMVILVMVFLLYGIFETNVILTSLNFTIPALMMGIIRHLLPKNAPGNKKLTDGVPVLLKSIGK